MIKINIGTSKGNIVGHQINRGLEEITISFLTEIARDHFHDESVSIIGWYQQPPITNDSRMDDLERELDVLIDDIDLKTTISERVIKDEDTPKAERIKILSDTIQFLEDSINKLSADDEREIVFAAVEDCAKEFLKYGRKDDEDLSEADLNRIVYSGKVDKEEIVNVFEKCIMDWETEIEDNNS